MKDGATVANLEARLLGIFLGSRGNPSDPSCEAHERKGQTECAGRINLPLPGKKNNTKQTAAATTTNKEIRRYIPI